MPIGPITPGVPVDVSADPAPTLLSTVQAPSPTMPVVANALEVLTLDMLNNDKALDTKKLDLTGGTLSGPLIVNANVTCVNLTAVGNGTVDGNFVAGRYLESGLWVTLTDQNHSIDTASGGQFFVFGGAPAADRTITLLETTGSPLPDNTYLEFLVPMNSNTHFINIVREHPGGVGYTVAVLGDGAGVGAGVKSVAWCRVMKSGGRWWLRHLSGLAFYGLDSFV